MDLAEVYSPKRVTAEGEKMGLRIGEAMDLTTVWDFRKQEDRDRAWRYVKESKPRLLIGSPMCTMFSKLQSLSPWNEEKEKRWCEAVKHIQFVVSLYRMQIKEGRYFLHEHPAQATSWGLKEIMQLGNEEQVRITKVDQCMYGLKTLGKDGVQMSAKKPTRFMTNSAYIVKRLSKVCDHSHEHQELLDGRAKYAARYPVELCRAICQGLMEEIRDEESNLKCVMSLTNAHRVRVEYRDRSGGKMNEVHEEIPQDEAWDDVSGACLDPAEVKKARLEEIRYVRKKKVWVKMSRQEAIRLGIKIIKTKWIDINKGDVTNPIHRSRFVGKEFNDGEVEGLFAATPPLEALRLLVSEAATTGGEEKLVMLNDVARAFFEAPMRRKLCIELPEEDLEDGETRENTVGLLLMSLYGTRDAATNFQQEVKKFMTGNGFKQGLYNPCVYHHKGRELKTLVHVDDFVTTGSRSGTEWLKERLKNRFEIKSATIGSGPGEAREARILNRIVRVTQEGWEYEPDGRHVEILVRELNLTEAKGLSTPIEDEKSWEKEENEEKLSEKEHRGFRALASRANYLGQDRADIQYTVKEICRGMAAPTKWHMKLLRRLGRYLVSYPRIVTRYEWQSVQSELSGYSDSDWAGCQRTARSTSGGAIM